MSQDSKAVLQVCKIAKNLNPRLGIILGFEVPRCFKYFEKNVNNTWCLNLAFFRPLKRSSNVNTENGFTFSIWRFEGKVMNKKKVEN